MMVLPQKGWIKMKTKIILLLVISSLIIGCIEKQSVSSKNVIPETFDDIATKFEECGKTMTTAQCDDWIQNHINGNYVRWNGVVSDVRGDVIIVKVEWKDMRGGYCTKETPCIDKKSIILHDVIKEELLKLKPNENIRFTGKINEFIVLNNLWVKNKHRESWVNDVTGSHIDLYDVNIEQILM